MFRSRNNPVSSFFIIEREAFLVTDGTKKNEPIARSRFFLMLDFYSQLASVLVPSAYPNPAEGGVELRAWLHSSGLLLNPAQMVSRRLAESRSVEISIPFTTKVGDPLTWYLSTSAW